MGFTERRAADAFRVGLENSFALRRYSCGNHCDSMNKRDERLVLLSITLFWLVSAVLHVGGYAYLMRLENKPLDWPSLAIEFRHWLYYIGLAPLCLWLARRFPLTRDAWQRSLLLVTLAGGIAALILAALELYDAYRHAQVLNRPFNLSFAALKFPIWAGFSNWITFAMTAAVVYGLHYFREVQRLGREAAEHAVRVAELERNLVGAQLRALQSQLQPHFIFNAHHAINGLIMKGENAKAVRMLTQLSDLLRLTLEQRTTPTVSLRHELELLQHYLEIQQTRFGDRLRVELEIPDDTLPAQVPSLILQPLVENGIKHGIERCAEPGELRIGATRANGTLTLTVENSGAVLPVSAPPPRHGVGLSTTCERLQQLFGNAHQFRLAARPAGGMCAELTIPFVVAPLASSGRIATGVPRRTHANEPAGTAGSTAVTA